MTVDELRKDLSDIRYYYSRKVMFDRAAGCVAKNAAIALAERYNGAIRNAPPKTPVDIGKGKFGMNAKI